jgi:DNA-binding NtrC family response regulator
LVADDDDGVRLSLAANLELEGYRVTEAVDGGHALSLIESEAFDLVVSDIAMPVATGVDVLHGLKAKSPDTPLILISAFAAEALIGRAVSEGLYAILYKPVGVSEILRVMARALKKGTVLLVDDSESYLHSLAASMRAVGFNVEAAPDGQSAIKFAQTNAVDVCVLDLMMSPTDGVTTCEALRAIDAGMDVIAITGAANSEMVRRIMRQGVSTCLRKPFDVRDLLGALVKVRGSNVGRKV